MNTINLNELLEKYLAMDQHNYFLAEEVKQIDLNNNTIMLNNYLTIEIDNIKNEELKNFLELALIEFECMSIKFNKIFKQMYSINYLDNFTYNNVNLFMKMYDDVIDLKNQKDLTFTIFICGDLENGLETVKKDIKENGDTLDPAFSKLVKYNNIIYIYYNWIL